MKFNPERLTRVFESPEKKTAGAIQEFSEDFCAQMIATSEDSRLFPLHQEAIDGALLLGVRSKIITTDLQGFCQQAVYRQQELTPLPFDPEGNPKWSMVVLAVWDNNPSDPTITHAVVEAMALPRYSGDAVASQVLAINFGDEKASYTFSKSGYRSVESFTQNDRRMPETIAFWQKQLAGAEVVVQPPPHYDKAESPRGIGRRAISGIFRRQR